jgi:SAM-dependent methyltransferase
MGDDKQGSAADQVARKVSSFYEHHPYPPPVDSLERHRERWNGHRRRADAHLFWPDEPYRDDRSILIAGCGTSQAAKYALAWPQAKVTGIDVSATSIQRTQKLKQKYQLDNLEVHLLPVERALELGRGFEYIVCTGVLHHLPDPNAGLRGLHEVLEPTGAMHLMVYAPYGRTGIYLLQDYCRRLGIGTSSKEIKDLASSLTSLPLNHPLVPLLRDTPDFRDEAALADALLHPQDRAYSVPQLLDYLAAGGLQFGRWVRQASYLPQCGALASTPHQDLLSRLPLHEQYAAVELFRGSMIRHSVVAYRSDRPNHGPIDFTGDEWPAYVPIRLPDTIMVQERLPPGAAAVLINPNHTFTDLYLPIDARQKMMFDAIDGKRSISEIVPQIPLRDAARTLFERLWRYDQVVFDASNAAQRAAEMRRATRSP